VDPTPTPLRDETVIQVFDDIAVFGVGGAVMLVAALILIGMLVFAIYQSAKYRPEAMLVIVLGVIAIVGSMGYLVGGESRAELITLAAAAVGALAGALTILANVAGQKEPGPFEYPEEEKDALQVTEAEALDVGEQAKHGERMGERIEESEAQDQDREGQTKKEVK